jgi:hypothetical protein
LAASAPAFVSELNKVDLPTFGKPTIPSFIFYLSPSKSIDFTVFSIFMTLLVIAFCILPHFYLFLYPA